MHGTNIKMRVCFSATGFIIINYGYSSGGVVEAYLMRKLLLQAWHSPKHLQRKK